MGRSKRTIATDISSKVRNEVLVRDQCCVICGSYQMLSIAHYIPRSKGGLGIKQNLVVACIPCHIMLDHSIDRKNLLQIVEERLRSCYKDFDESALIYRKGKTYE